MCHEVNTSKPNVVQNNVVFKRKLCLRQPRGTMLCLYESRDPILGMYYQILLNQSLKNHGLSQIYFKTVGFQNILLSILYLGQM